MRFDGVEIKVTLGREQTGPAVQELGLPPQQPWQIWFWEDVTPGSGLGTPLLDLGVILRARDKAGDDDATIKLRPCRRSQLTDHWLAAEKGKTDDGDEWTLEVEADWSGDRRLLAVSHTCERPGDLVREAGSGDRPVEDLFAREQLDFLRDCEGTAINFATLTALSPVTATRWKSVAAAPAHLGVRAERWTVGDLDFLELSVVADLAEAREKQAALTGFVRSLSLPDQPAAQPESKTRQVLEHLVALAAETR
ncbi:hypothetical protein [Geodermatophilus sabuli]|uniref:CYTH domain-containing protein n=1 Tax=Geodermatophilus sabuli TaxID=1564158 RepID=A0A285EF22_9ACTN|nr:hypothetical protein [Geodermatophilus sabuli]MBB3084075.1 hypothetical protein [Geodermatophilus sabuli]SNX96651.1 hypothetical protein SAMN06893097_104366 [Geodermatophilus sabuli]